MEKFNERLKALRKENKMTQEDLAKALGISRSTVGMYETGKREADFETLEAIADLFNVDMNYLLCRSNKKLEISFDELRMKQLLCKLNSEGKREAVKRVDELTCIPKYQANTDYLKVQAAHERTDIEVTDEMRKHDDDIMNNDDFWE